MKKVLPYLFYQFENDELVCNWLYLTSKFLVFLDEHLTIPNNAEMEVHSVKNSKQFSDLDSMPKISINTNITIPNQSIDSVHDSSTRDDIPKNEKKSNGKITCCMK